MARQVNVTEERIEFTAVDKMSAVMKQAQSQIRELRSSIDTVKNALAAVGVTVGVGAMLSLYRETLTATAALDDFAESTGAAVSTLSAMQRVAKVGSADFGLVTDSMGKMIKGLKESGEAGLKVEHALKALDISAKNTDGTFRDQGDVMVEVAQKLNRYADSGNKVALVQDLYGKGAQNLLPYLKDLADSTDRHATVTKEQAAQAEEAEKNIRRLQLTMEDARRASVVGITPAIIDFTNKLLEATKASGGLIAGLATMASADTGNIQARIQEIDQIIERHEKNMDRPTAGLGNKFLNLLTAPADAAAKVRIGRLMAERAYLEGLRNRQLGGLMQGMVEDAAGIHPAPAAARLAYRSPQVAPKGLSPYESAVLARQQEAAKAQMGDNEFISTQLDIQAGKYGKLTEAQKRHLLQLAAEVTQQKALAHDRDEHTKAIEAATKAADEETKRLVERAEVYKDLLSASRPLIREEEELAELRRRGILLEAQYQEIMIRRSEIAREKIIGQTEQTAAAAAAGHQLGLSFQSSFDTIIEGAGRSINALDLLRAAALDVGKVLWGRLVTAPIAAGIESRITRAFATPTYPDASSITGPFGGFDAGAIAAMEFHRGGVVGIDGRRRYVHPAYFERPRRMHSGGLVGDEMPIVAKKGEEVLTQSDPRHRANLGGGAVTIVQTNNFSVGVRGEVRAEIASQLPRIAAVSRAAIDEARRRGAS